VIALLLKENELDEIHYLLRREMDDLLYDFRDDRVDDLVKSTLQKRYKVLFSLFKRVASPRECMLYMLKSERKQ
jgi:hypothetical protein